MDVQAVAVMGRPVVGYRRDRPTFLLRPKFECGEVPGRAEHLVHDLQHVTGPRGSKAAWPSEDAPGAEDHDDQQHQDTDEHLDEFE